MHSSRQDVEDYISWLIGFVCSDSQRDIYQSLFSILLETEFYPVVERDINRGKDGLQLRYDYADQNGLYRDFWVDDLPDYCSVLEMLVALAISWDNDIVFGHKSGQRIGLWFWEMLQNLGIAEETDFDFNDSYINMCLNTFINRDYGYDGVGGLFPLHDPPCDQRECEIWYQMNYYIMERYPINGEGE